MKIDIEKYPYYLKHDIEELIRAEDEMKQGKECYHIDCLQDELYASIGSAYRENVISKDEAQYLYEKYLGMRGVI